MTRLLSDLLGAPQPSFAHRLKQLEKVSGEPGADIRLTTDILQRSQAKIRELGLDPQDTTGPELYQVLQQRLLSDEQRLREHLNIGSKDSPAAILAQVLQFEKKLSLPRSCFALKTSVVKRLLRAQPPKKAMNHLGYRSLDSMLKHESVASIYTASMIFENSHWHQTYLRQYDHLSPSDFETREVQIQYPRAQRWEAIAETFSKDYRHTSAVFKELGTMVVLPVQSSLPALAITSLLSLLDGLNTIRCASTYLKLQQVNANFGAVVRQVNLSEPTTTADFAGQPLPWRVVQYYYHMAHEAYHPALFEPHVQPEDLALAEAETALAEAIPALAFWEDTAGLAHVDQGQTVSMNMLDVALSAANGLAYEQRIVKHVREQVWSDIIIRYLRHRNLDYLAEQLSQPQETPTIDQGALV